MATKKAGMSKSAHLTPKQADALQEKLRSAIRATTKQIERKNMNPTHVQSLKKYRKMLMNANEFFGWSIRNKAYDAPSRKRQIQ